MFKKKKEEIDSKFEEKLASIEKDTSNSSVLSIVPTIMMLTPYIIYYPLYKIL